MNLKLKSSKSLNSLNSLKSSKFKSTKRYRRRKVRENNKNKYGIDKTLNRRVTQKVWRLPGGPREKQQQQQQEKQEKYKNMHSMTSRHQERKERQGQGHRDDDDDITKVKTLQDATLKASRLYGMMRDFIHPSKINYRKIHSKWRNVKKQVQVGGIEPAVPAVPAVPVPTLPVPPEPAGTVTVPVPGAETGPVDDKDCVELPSKLSLHVTQDPGEPKKFIVKRLPGDLLIDGSLTRFAEGLMGHLDKMKSEIEIDTGDAGVLALIAHDLISLILDVLDKDHEEDPEDPAEKQKRLKAALDRESRNAAAAAILIALIGLIKEKDEDDGSSSSSSSDWSSVTGSSRRSSLSSDDIDDGDAYDRLLADFRQLQDRLTQANARFTHLLQEVNTDNRRLGEDNAGLRNQIAGLTDDLNTVGARFEAWYQDQLARINDDNLQQVHTLQTRNQHIMEGLARLNQHSVALATQLAQIQNQNVELTAELNALRQTLQNSEQQNADRQQQLQQLTQQAQEREAELRAQIATLQQTGDQQQTTIAQQEHANRQLVLQVGNIQTQLAEAERALATAQAAAAAAQVDQAAIQGLQDNVDRLTQETRQKDTELAASQGNLATTQRALLETQAQIQRLQGENRDKERQITQSKTNIQAQEAEINKLKDEIAAAGRGNTAAAAAAARQLQVKETELLQAREQLDKLQRANGEMLEANRRQGEQIGDLTQQHAATAGRLETATQLAADLQRQLEQLGTENSEEKRGLEARLTNQQQIVTDLTQMLQGQDEQLTQLQDANIGLQQENDNKQTQLTQANESAERTRTQLDTVSGQLQELQHRLESTSTENTAARDELQRQIDAIQVERSNLERRLDQQTGEIERMRASLEENAQALQRQGQELQSQQEKTQQALEALRQELLRRLDKVRDKILQLPQQLQDRFRERINGIQGAITAMTDPTEYNGLNQQITDLKADQRRAQDEEEQQRRRAEEEEDQQRRREQEAQARSDVAIRARLNARLLDIPEDAQSRSDIATRIKVANTLQDECEITKSILLAILDIISSKITSMREEDECKPVHQKHANDIRAEIGRIVCTNSPQVNGIEGEYERIKKRFKGLQEAIGDKIRTFVALRGGGAKGITLDISGSKVSWNGETVEFSGVDATKSNVNKYTKVKDLLDSVPETESTVVIFGYGYSGSGKTYTLLGKRLEDALKSLALDDKQKLHSIDTLQAKMNSVKMARDHDSYMTAITGLKTFLKNSYAHDKVDRVEEVEGIAHIAIRNYRSAGNEVILEEVFEMYDDSYYFDSATGGKYETQLPIFGYTIRGEMRRWTTLQGLKLDYNIGDVDKFNEVIRKVEQTRRTNKHIKPTPNNPESSRGHLFINLKIIHRDGKTGRLIICDMGGRENPQNIWNDGKYCPSLKGGDPNPISRSERNIAYTDDGIEVECSAPDKDRLSFSKAFSPSIGNIKLETALQSSTKGNPGILQTLKQGFYINDSINELLDVFGYKGTDKDTNWKYNKLGTGALRNTWEYFPTTRAKSVSDHIQMKLIFDKFKKESDCKITFCTFACIRSEPEFNDDNVNTLNFARDVNSCSAAGGGGDAAIAIQQPPHPPPVVTLPKVAARRVLGARGGVLKEGGAAKTRRKRPQGKVRTQRRRRGRRIVKPKSHPVTVVTTQRRNMRDKKKGHRTRKMK